MRRRGEGADGIPDALLHYRRAEWPSGQAWHAARDTWRDAHPPRSLGEMNRWYADDVVFPPEDDPRMGLL